MQSSIRIWAPLLALGLTLVACQRDESVNINQDSIWAEYRLVYDASEDKTYARTTFRFGGASGTLLELSDGAEVTFDGDPLSYRAVLAYYQREYAGYVNGGEFSYLDLDDNRFVNPVTTSPAIALPARLDTIPKGSAYTLAWEGDPIAAGESVIVTLNGQIEADAKLFTTEDIGATEIILDQDKLDEVGSGTVRITIERFKAQLLQEGTSEQGAVWSRYLSGVQEIQVVD
jgi:hypothetical protein